MSGLHKATNNNMVIITAKIWHGLHECWRGMVEALLHLSKLWMEFAPAGWKLEGPVLASFRLTIMIVNFASSNKAAWQSCALALPWVAVRVDACRVFR